MNRIQVIQFLEHLRRTYLARKLLSYGLQSLGLGILLAVVVGKWVGPGGWAWLAGVVATADAFAFLVIQKKLLQTNVTDVALHLDRTQPELEQSCQLLFKADYDLTLLERLQRQRLLAAMTVLQNQAGRQFYKRSLIAVSFQRAWIVPVACVLSALAVSFIPNHPSSSNPSLIHLGKTRVPARLAKALPRIQEMEILVTPPAYTRTRPHVADGPNLKVAQGSRIRWKITTNQSVDSLVWVLNDRVRQPFKAARGTSNAFTWEQSVTESGFYYLEIESRKSDYYAIEIIPDKAPEILVQSPQQYTKVQFGDPLHVTLKAILTDDYGIRDANLVATVAKGSGEAVKFREEKMLMNNDFRVQNPSYSVQKNLDLAKLGMSWGDELYFYLQTWDNHRGYIRSETYFVQMEDTALVETSADLSMGINPMPEYFRSQRQIIIDTEKLIQEKPKLSAEEFNTRSNNIGIDQRILRLRYGKFLGEEAESGTGEIAGKEVLEKEKDEHDDHEPEEHSTGSPTTFGQNSADLLAPYSHRHDSEEGATFLEPAVKAKLKASLAQMWEAELKLRTHLPRAALPFEYQALKWLKEVQQSTRAYVQKTGFDPPPIKVQEKRLTGDLSKVQTVRNQSNQQETISSPNIRLALAWVERQRQTSGYRPGDADLLEKAGQELAQEALRSPGQYLQALQDLRKLVAQIQARQPRCAACLATVEKAFWQLLPESSTSPVRLVSQRNPLSDSYFRRLSNSGIQK